MGIRFRRSIKVAPGVKLNLGKKSVGMTVGVKGAHVSVNSKGRKTKTVGIPGTGLSYVESKNIIGSKKKTSTKKEKIYSPSDSSSSNADIESNAPQKKNKKKLIIGVLVVLFLIGILGGSDKVDSITAEWPSTDFDINDTVKVKIHVEPEEADINDLTISDNDIAKMEYSNGIAKITFIGEGSADIVFICGDVKSNSTSISVIDKAAEEQREKEAKEAAEEQARQEAEEQARQESARQPQEQVQMQTNTQPSQTQETQQTEMVWIPQTGSKYHSKASCSNMENPQQVSLEYAQSLGLTPCKRCH